MICLQLPVAGLQMGLGDIHQPPLWQRGAADHDHFFHFYAQDTWNIRSRFSLSYGLGWSYESNALNHDLTKPAYLAPIFGVSGPGHDQHSPRNFSLMLGFAWTVTNDHKTVVRGGAALPGGHRLERERHRAIDRSKAYWAERSCPAPVTTSSPSAKEKTL